MGGGKHCYPGSDVLVNKYNIRDKDTLEKLEIQKATTRLIGIDIYPERVNSTFDTAHLCNIHKYIFGDIYEWAGEFRDENIYKSERVLSGGSVEYSNYNEIDCRIKKLLENIEDINWNDNNDIVTIVLELLLDLWTIHPFREGNTRTCITFIWHYLKAKGINFKVELLRNNPMYVRDSLVMANYDQKQYLQKILEDALNEPVTKHQYDTLYENKEQYQIKKSDYEAFKEKYSIK